MVLTDDGTLTQDARKVMQALARQHEQHDKGLIPFNVATGLDPRRWEELVDLVKHSLIGITRRGETIQYVYLTVTGWRALGRTKGTT